MNLFKYHRTACDWLRLRNPTDFSSHIDRLHSFVLYATYVLNMFYRVYTLFRSVTNEKHNIIIIWFSFAFEIVFFN